MLEISFTTWIISILVSMSIPAAITSFIFVRINKKIDRQEKRREEQQKNFENLILLTAQNIRTTYSVARESAETLKAMNPKTSRRIDIKIQIADEHQQKVQEFLIHQGVINICE